MRKDLVHRRSEVVSAERGPLHLSVGEEVRREVHERLRALVGVGPREHLQPPDPPPQPRQQLTGLRLWVEGQNLEFISNSWLILCKNDFYINALTMVQRSAKRRVTRPWNM